MSLEQINEALKDSPELMKEVGMYFAQSQDVAVRVNNLEKMRDEAVDKYGKLKGLVRDTTGLNELTKESIASAFTPSDALDALKSDNLTLQQTMKTLQSEKDGLSATHEQELSKMIMLEQLRGMEVDSQVWNPRALEDLANDLLKGTNREDRKFIFTNEDNTSQFNNNGQAMSIADKIAEIRDSGETYYFKPIQGGGGGKTEAPTPTQTSKLEGAVASTIAAMTTNY